MWIHTVKTSCCDYPVQILPPLQTPRLRVAKGYFEHTQYHPLSIIRYNVDGSLSKHRAWRHTGGYSRSLTTIARLFLSPVAFKRYLLLVIACR